MAEIELEDPSLDFLDQWSRSVALAECGSPTTPLRVEVLRLRKLHPWAMHRR